MSNKHALRVAIDCNNNILLSHILVTMIWKAKNIQLRGIEYQLM